MTFIRTMLESGIYPVYAHWMMKIVRLYLLIAASAILAGPAWAGDIDRLIVFGDSLSDTGNVFSVSRPPLPPSPPYGGLNPRSGKSAPGRFSNGPVWVEYLAKALRVPVPRPRGVGSNPRPGRTNYAWGGAVTGLEPAVYRPSLTPHDWLTGGLPVGRQIGQYLGDVNAKSRKGDLLFVMWAGSNNIALLDQSNMGKVVRDLYQYISTLIATGARQILVPNLPAIEKAPAVTPGFRSLFLVDDISSANKIAKRVRRFNTKLRKALRKIGKRYPHVRIYQLDVFSLFDAFLRYPKAFGFNANTSVPALNERALFLGMDVKFRNNPLDSLFWDGIHITTRAHKLVAREALRLLRD